MHMALRCTASFVSVKTTFALSADTWKRKHAKFRVQGFVSMVDEVGRRAHFSSWVMTMS